MTGHAGGGGGGGGGVGIEAATGRPGRDAPDHRYDGEAAAGGKYVVLVGAGGVGGRGAKRPEDHGEGGTAGGYSVITDGQNFVLVFDGRAPAGDRTELSDLDSQPDDASDVPVIQENETPDDGERFAIVDTQSNVIDNVVVADREFFEDPFVIDAILGRALRAHRARHAVLVGAAADPVAGFNNRLYV